MGPEAFQPGAWLANALPGEFLPVEHQEEGFGADRARGLPHL